MRPAEGKPIRLGGGHCCACTTACGHIGGPYLCLTHKVAERRCDQPFIERLRRRVDEDRTILERLSHVP